MRHQTQQEVAGRQEIGVEDRDELPARDLEAGLERARLEPGPVAAVDVLDVDALRRQPLDRQLGDAARLVGRVVQHLDFEPVARVLDGAHRVDQPIGDVHLVVERQLDRHDRERFERRAGFRLVVPVPHVQVHEVVPVPAVDGENDQDEEVRGERERFQRRSWLTRECPATAVRSRLERGAQERRKLRWHNGLYYRWVETTSTNRADESIRTPTTPRRRGARRDRPRRTPINRCWRCVRASPFEDLGFARVDHHRAVRQGFPEVVLGLGKTPAQIAAIAAEIVRRGSTLLVTRASDAAYAAVRARCATGSVLL